MNVKLDIDIVFAQRLIEAYKLIDPHGFFDGTHILNYRKQILQALKVEPVARGDKGNEKATSGAPVDCVSRKPRG